MYDLPPARTGRRGRPRAKGDRLGSLAALASATTFGQITVTRYGKTAAISVAAVTCLWPSVFGTRPVTVVLIRDKPGTGYDLALVTTDPGIDPAQVIQRYAARWSIEVAIEDARQVFGAGQARNRTARAVERTVPFQLACQAIATTWYATAGHDPADVADHLLRPDSRGLGAVAGPVRPGPLPRPGTRQLTPRARPGSLTPRNKPRRSP